MRIKAGPTTRSSGSRKRSNAALDKRNARKDIRGWGPDGPRRLNNTGERGKGQSGRGRSCGS
eukprot:3486811-Alexandrium_andersonii.AAC.1